ncbi:DNA polymerase IV [bacterium]|jgi:DNA polymerase IV|nr:DNA polymerase IV [bacterium]
MTRKIIHVDMDAFFASVEMLDRPELKNKPVIVGGDPNKRGVVAAANYVARKFGVRSAMPSRQAKQLCPEGIFISGNFERYREISGQIREVLYRYTDTLEPLGLDEAWLDISTNKLEEPSATRLALRLQKDIYETIGLTCSIGVSYCKFLAKIATEENKPNGIFVIPPEKAHLYIMQLAVARIPGVGKVTQKKMDRLGIHTGSDLYSRDRADLLQHFGKYGLVLYDRVRGQDNRPIGQARVRKSLSADRTFQEDYTYGPELVSKLQGIAKETWRRLEKNNLKGRSITLKVRFKSFHQLTRAITLEAAISSEKQLFTLAQGKLQEICDEHTESIRLLGIGISHFSNSIKMDSKSDKPNQLILFK